MVSSKWQKDITETGENYRVSDIVTVSDGVLMVGETGIEGIGFSDIYLTKLDKKGNILWEKTYGEEKAESGSAMILTDDCGLVVAGCKLNDEGSEKNIYVLKMNLEGEL